MLILEKNCQSSSALDWLQSALLRTGAEITFSSTGNGVNFDASVSGLPGSDSFRVRCATVEEAITQLRAKVLKSQSSSVKGIADSMAALAGDDSSPPSSPPA